MSYDWTNDREDTLARPPRSDANPDSHKTPIMRDIARTIIKQRLGPKQLSRAQLARLAGVSPASIRNIEHGRCDPSITMVDSILRALGFQLTITPK